MPVMEPSTNGKRGLQVVGADGARTAQRETPAEKARLRIARAKGGEYINLFK